MCTLCLSSGYNDTAPTCIIDPSVGCSGWYWLTECWWTVADWSKWVAHVRGLWGLIPLISICLWVSLNRTPKPHTDRPGHAVQCRKWDKQTWNIIHIFYLNKKKTVFVSQLTVKTCIFSLKAETMMTHFSLLFIIPISFSHFTDTILPCQFSLND